MIRSFQTFSFLVSPNPQMAADLLLQANEVDVRADLSFLESSPLFASLKGADQNKIAETLRAMPHAEWRRLRHSLFQPSDSRRHNQILLLGVYEDLKALLGSREFTLKASAEDKTFLRTVVGGLTLFLGSLADKGDIEIAGMASEVAGHLADRAIQQFFEGAPVFVERPAETPSPLPSQLPFDYHPESEEKVEAMAEDRIQLVQRRLEDSDIHWPYDFVKWCRTLYLLAEAVGNGDAARIKQNFTKSLRRLFELPSIDVWDVRRLLGTVGCSVGKPLWALPNDWPRDLPNDFGSAVILLFDSGDPAKKDIEPILAHVTVELWRAAKGNPQERVLQKSLLSVVQKLERTLLAGKELDIEEAYSRIETVATTLSHPVSLPSLGDKPAREEPTLPAASLEVMSQKEWSQKAVQFLREQIEEWGKTPGVLAKRLEYILGVEETSPAWLQTAFRLAVSYRETCGVKSGLEHLEGIESPSYQSLLGEEGLFQLLSCVTTTDLSTVSSVSESFAKEHPELRMDGSMIATLLDYFMGISRKEPSAEWMSRLETAVPLETTGIASGLESEAEEATGEMEEPLFRDLNFDKYTPYGRVFALAVVRGRVMRKGKNSAIFFGRFLNTTEKLYRLYRELAKQTGEKSFDKAFEKVVNAKYWDAYRPRYQKVFDQLVDIFGKDPQAASIVENAILTGEIKVVADEAEKLAVSGGPPKEKGEKPETVLEPAASPTMPPPSAEPEPEREPVLSPSPSVPAAPAVSEAVFSGIAVVSPDTLGDLLVTGAVETFPPVAEPSPSIVLPDVFEKFVAAWELGASEKKAIDDLSKATSVEAVLSALENIEKTSREMPRGKRAILTHYAQVLEQNRITAQAKTRLVSLLSSPTEFGRAMMLLLIAAVKQSGLVLDQLLPLPLQLGRNGRQVVVSDQKGAPPKAVSRPAMTLDEGYFAEEAVTPSNTTVLFWGPVKEEEVDIGLEGHRIVRGPGKLLGNLARARGAIKSGVRSSLMLVVFANEGMTPRARRYFFLQFREERLLVWRGNGFSIFRLEETEHGIIEKELRFDREGKTLPGQSNLFRPLEGELDRVEVNRGDRHPQTPFLIERMVRQGMDRLTKAGMGRKAITLKVVMNAAITEVGFLPPGHPDARNILEICNRFTKRELTSEGILKIQDDLDGAIKEIERRFEPKTAGAAAAIPMPEREDVTPLLPEEDLATSPISPPPVEEKPGDSQTIVKRIGEDEAQDFENTLSEVGLAVKEREEALQALAAICNAYLHSHQSELIEMVRALKNNYRGRDLKEAHSRLLKLGSLAAKGKSLETVAPIIVRYSFKNGSVDKSFELAELLGRERFAKLIRDCFTATGNVREISSGSIEKMMTNLLALKKRLAESDTIAVVDELLAVSGDFTEFGHLFNRFMLLARLCRESDSDIVKISLKQPGQAVTRDEKLVLIGTVRSEPFDNRSAVAKALTPYIREAKKQLMEKKISGVVLALFGDKGITQQARESLWDIFGESLEIRILESSRASTGQRYRAVISEEGPGEISAVLEEESTVVFEHGPDGLVKTTRTGDPQIRIVRDPGDLARPKPPPPGPKKAPLSKPVFAWDPAKADWMKIFEEGGYTAKKIQETLEEILGRPLGEESQLTYDALAKHCGYLASAIKGHIVAIQPIFRESLHDTVNGWTQRLSEMDLQIAEAFDSSPTEEEGLKKIRDLPSVFEEMSGLLRDILSKEIKWYQSVLAKPGAPFDLTTQKEIIESLSAQLSDQVTFLNEWFFRNLLRVRALFVNRADTLHELLAAKRYEFGDRSALELPPHRASMEDLEAFLERYGFVFDRQTNRSKVYLHSATGIVAAVPLHASYGSAPLNARLEAIRSVEESLRKQDRMAPA